MGSTQVGMTGQAGSAGSLLGGEASTDGREAVQLATVCHHVIVVSVVRKAEVPCRRNGDLFELALGQRIAGDQLVLVDEHHVVTYVDDA